jgi:simple sugar transport system ATP-binding protein
VLTPQEAESFFGTLQELKGHGKTIIFISHKLREVKRIADRVTIMRDARVISTRQASELSEQDIAYLMVGREISSERLAPPRSPGPALLSVRDLSFVNEENLRVLSGVSFDVRAGEIVGLAGVEGNSQTELVRILTGLLPATSGTVAIRGRVVNGSSPRRIRQAGAAHIPEDRMEDGAAAEASVQENVIVDRFYKADFSRGLILLWAAVARHTRSLIERFHILARSPRTPVASLSGGNIQKVVVARELSSEPEVIIACQPTRGIDVGSEEMVHNLLAEARDRGKAVFLASADLDEVLKLSNRILVIFNGELVAHFRETAGLSGQDLGPYMLGVKKEEAASGEVHP